MNDPQPEQPEWLTAVQSINQDVSARGLDWLMLDPDRIEDMIEQYGLGEAVAEAIQAIKQE